VSKTGAALLLLAAAVAWFLWPHNAASGPPATGVVTTVATAADTH
jgi:hypothetical protein